MVFTPFALVLVPLQPLACSSGGPDFLATSIAMRCSAFDLRGDDGPVKERHCELCPVPLAYVSPCFWRPRGTVNLAQFHWPRLALWGY